MSSKDLTPLYYSEAQMAQMLTPQRAVLSDIATPTDLSQISTVLNAQQQNQADQPAGYAGGGRVFPKPHFRGFAGGGQVGVLPLNHEVVNGGYTGSDYKEGGRVEPSEAQKHAGNYKKMHGHVQGVPISVENPKGSTRSGTGRDGKPWSVTMPAHYGYIKGTVGADKDHVDVYVGDHISNKQAHIIDQKDAETGKFDEHKVMLGFESPAHALHAYHNSFSDGKAHLRMGGMVSMNLDDFKKWVKTKKLTQKPVTTSYATGGRVVPIKRDKELVPTHSYVAPLPHYRDTMDGGILSRFRNDMQNKVRNG